MNDILSQTFAFARTDEGDVTLFDKGASRDVLAVQGYSKYLLKIQAASWANSSNKRELDHSRSTFSSCIPPVYGCVETEFSGTNLSVLAVERKSTDFLEYLRDMLSKPCTPDAVRDLIGLQAAFYCLVRYAAVELKYSVRDLHFKNVGIVSEDFASSVVFLGSESCFHDPTTTEKQRVKDGVRVWLASWKWVTPMLRNSQANWAKIINVLKLEEQRWWAGVTDVLPLSEQIENQFRLVLEQALQIVSMVDLDASDEEKPAATGLSHATCDMGASASAPSASGIYPCPTPHMTLERPGVTKTGMWRVVERLDPVWSVSQYNDDEWELVNASTNTSTHDGPITQCSDDNWCLVNPSIQNGSAETMVALYKRSTSD